MAKSEIDDIFAAKGKARLPAASSSSSQASSTTKKKTKKRRREQQDITGSNHASSPSAVIPETIIDSSSILPPHPKRARNDKAADKVKPSQPDTDFAGSRGRSSRRQTEEGWNVYKEDELCMSQEGGDTPLCPFDCECCY